MWGIPMRWTCLGFRLVRGISSGSSLSSKAELPAGSPPLVLTLLEPSRHLTRTRQEDLPVCLGFSFPFHQRAKKKVEPSVVLFPHILCEGQSCGGRCEEHE